MRSLPLLAAPLLALALSAAPAAAQTSTPTPEHEANSAGTAPSTASANGQADAAATGRQAAVGEQNMDAQAQYAADMAAYDDAVRAHHAATLADEVRWHRQQRAYADAMIAWREQVRACKAGSTRACNAPSPDPAAYY